MAGDALYHVLDEHPYLDREEERRRLTLDEAVRWVEDRTGIDEEVILDDIASGVMPWKWADEETGREVSLHLEVE